MQRVFTVVFLLAASMSAQQVGLPGTQAISGQITERIPPVTSSDLYCAGFLTPQPLPREHFVTAGLESPAQSEYRDRDLIYVRGGGLAPGTRVGIIRPVQDPNRYTPFPIAQRLLAKSGQLYAELGYASIVANRGTDLAVARIEFSCESIVIGDLVVPFTPKPMPSYRDQSTLDLFPADRAKVNARIVAANNFDQFPGPGNKIYLNVGAKGGVKPGDYFRIVRNYESSSMDPAEQQVFQQPVGDVNQPKSTEIKQKQIRDLPYRLVGEALILSTQADTATAMITFAVEEIHVGDLVELEEGQSR